MLVCILHEKPWHPSPRRFRNSNVGLVLGSWLQVTIMLPHQQSPEKVSLPQGLLYSRLEKLYLMMWSIFSVLWAFIWKDLTPVYCSSVYFTYHLLILFRSLKQIFMSFGSTNWYVRRRNLKGMKPSKFLSFVVNELLVNWWVNSACDCLQMLLWLTRSCSTCVKRYLYFTNGKVISLSIKARYKQPFFFPFSWGGNWVHFWMCAQFSLKKYSYHILAQEIRITAYHWKGNNTCI